MSGGFNTNDLATLFGMDSNANMAPSSVLLSNLMHEAVQHGSNNSLSSTHGANSEGSSVASSTLASGSGSSATETGHVGEDYKLIVDPILRRAPTKVYRYRGRNSEGVSVVDVADPRPRMLRYAKREIADLPVPVFKLDEHYVAPILVKEVTFCNLNNNVNQSFLTDMCGVFGTVSECLVLYHHRTKKHLGIGKVVYTSALAAQRCVTKLNQTSLMGDKITVMLDNHGAERARLLHAIISLDKSSEQSSVPSPTSQLTSSVIDELRLNKPAAASVSKSHSSRVNLFPPIAVSKTHSTGGTTVMNKTIESQASTELSGGRTDVKPSLTGLSSKGTSSATGKVSSARKPSTGSETTVGKGSVIAKKSAESKASHLSSSSHSSTHSRHNHGAEKSLLQGRDKKDCTSREVNVGEQTGINLIPVQTAIPLAPAGSNLHVLPQGGVCTENYRLSEYDALPLAVAFRRNSIPSVRADSLKRDTMGVSTPDSLGHNVKGSSVPDAGISRFHSIDGITNTAQGCIEAAGSKFYPSGIVENRFGSLCSESELNDKLSCVSVRSDFKRDTGGDISNFSSAPGDYSLSIDIDRNLPAAFSLHSNNSEFNSYTGSRSITETALDHSEVIDEQSVMEQRGLEDKRGVAGQGELRDRRRSGTTEQGELEEGEEGEDDTATDNIRSGFDRLKMSQGSSDRGRDSYGDKRTDYRRYKDRYGGERRWGDERSRGGWRRSERSGSRSRSRSRHRRSRTRSRSKHRSRSRERRSRSDSRHRSHSPVTTLPWGYGPSRYCPPQFYPPPYLQRPVQEASSFEEELRLYQSQQHRETHKSRRRDGDSRDRRSRYKDRELWEGRDRVKRGSSERRRGSAVMKGSSKEDQNRKGTVENDKGVDSWGRTRSFRDVREKSAGEDDWRKTTPRGLSVTDNQPVSENTTTSGCQDDKLIDSSVASHPPSSSENVVEPRPSHPLVPTAMPCDSTTPDEASPRLEDSDPATEQSYVSLESRIAALLGRPGLPFATPPRDDEEEGADGQPPPLPPSSCPPMPAPPIGEFAPAPPDDEDEDGDGGYSPTDEWEKEGSSVLNKTVATSSKGVNKGAALWNTSNSSTPVGTWGGSQESIDTPVGVEHSNEGGVVDSLLAKYAQQAVLMARARSSVEPLGGVAGSVGGHLATIDTGMPPLLPPYPSGPPPSFWEPHINAGMVPPPDFPPPPQSYLHPSYLAGGPRPGFPGGPGLDPSMGYGGPPPGMQYGIGYSGPQFGYGTPGFESGYGLPAGGYVCNDAWGNEQWSAGWGVVDDRLSSLDVSKELREAVLERVRSELRVVLDKDVQKRLTENTGYRSLDTWWTESATSQRERERRRGEVQSVSHESTDPQRTEWRPAPATSSHTSTVPSLVPTETIPLVSDTSNKTITQPTPAEQSGSGGGKKDLSSTLAALFNSNKLIGGLLGLRGAAPKLPSFRRKEQPPPPTSRVSPMKPIKSSRRIIEDDDNDDFDELREELMKMKGAHQQHQIFRGPRTPEESDNEGESHEDRGGDMEMIDKDNNSSVCASRSPSRSPSRSRSASYSSSSSSELSDDEVIISKIRPANKFNVYTSDEDDDNDVDSDSSASVTRKTVVKSQHKQAVKPPQRDIRPDRSDGEQSVKSSDDNDDEDIKELTKNKNKKKNTVTPAIVTKDEDSSLDDSDWSEPGTGRDNLTRSNIDKQHDTVKRQSRSIINKSTAINKNTSSMSEALRSEESGMPVTKTSKSSKLKTAPHDLVDKLAPRKLRASLDVELKVSSSGDEAIKDEMSTHDDDKDHVRGVRRSLNLELSVKPGRVSGVDDRSNDVALKSEEEDADNNDVDVIEPVIANGDTVLEKEYKIGLDESLPASQNLIVHDTCNSFDIVKTAPKHRTTSSDSREALDIADSCVKFEKVDLGLQESVSMKMEKNESAIEEDVNVFDAMEDAMEDAVTRVVDRTFALDHAYNLPATLRGKKGRRAVRGRPRKRSEVEEEDSDEGTVSLTDSVIGLKRTLCEHIAKDHQYCQPYLPVPDPWRDMQCDFDEAFDSVIHPVVIKTDVGAWLESVPFISSEIELVPCDLVPEEDKDDVIDMTFGHGHVNEEHGIKRPAVEGDTSGDELDRLPQRDIKRQRLSLSTDLASDNRHRKHSVSGVGSRELASLLPPPVPPRPSYTIRPGAVQRAILEDILYSGIDCEDRDFLRKAYDRLRNNCHGDLTLTSFIQSVNWSEHPVTFIPDELYHGRGANVYGHKRSKKSRHQQADEGVLSPHKTGCARAEGFYKISHQVKYLRRARQADEPSTALSVAGAGGGALVTDSSKSRLLEQLHQQQLAKVKQQNRDARSESRRWQNAISTSLGEDCVVGDLLKFNQLKLRKKQLKFARSTIHNWGLFPLEPILGGEMITEYCGEVIRQGVGDLREKRYEAVGIGSSYLFRVDKDVIVDATKFGNLARFINHSCNPNCCAKIITVDSVKRIVIYSKQNINKNEEITYDYKFPLEEDKIPCLCGNTGCRGTLN